MYSLKSCIVVADVCAATSILSSVLFDLAVDEHTCTSTHEASANYLPASIMSDASRLSVLLD